MLDEITLQRLGLIRYLYEGAMEESRKPEPFGLIAILKFHDSVELFLDLACDKFGVAAKKNEGIQGLLDGIRRTSPRPKSCRETLNGSLERS